MLIQTAAEAKQDRAYYAALTDLLYQLADDDFILAYRGSEWLGLAPHIEEDVAFSSINQNTMGHAAMYYQLLAELGEGDADALAHARSVQARKNAIILEEVNGSGHYLHEPRYDWAFAVVRHFFYDVNKKLRLESLQYSSYEPLAQVAVKVDSEQYYHIMHWKTWFQQLTASTIDAKKRMNEAVLKVWDDFGGVLSLGPMADEMSAFKLIDSEESLKAKWLEVIAVFFEEAGLQIPGEPGQKHGNGRAGEHTPDLKDALDELGKVYHIDPSLTW